MAYHIIHKDDPDLFWCNQLGWTDKGYATEFTADERETLHLPIDGEWREVPRESKLWAFLLGMYEFRLDCTTHFTTYDALVAYDHGRDFAHKLTLRRFDDE